MNREFIDIDAMVVDIHKFSVLEAQHYLERLIAKVDTREVNEIIVIHGYNNGNCLQKLVRKTLRSKRIERRLTWWNEGRTSLILKH